MYERMERKKKKKEKEKKRRGEELSRKSRSPRCIDVRIPFSFRVRNLITEMVGRKLDEIHGMIKRIIIIIIIKKERRKIGFK